MRIKGLQIRNFASRFSNNTYKTTGTYTFAYRPYKRKTIEKRLNVPIDMRKRFQIFES